MTGAAGGQACRPDAVAGRPAPSRRSLRGLAWFIFFVANVQTGFGPFVAVYLTSQKWTQLDIGLVLTVSGLVALIGQMPGGALVDAARAERLVAALSVSAVGLSALAYAASPVFLVIAAAAILHALASCVLGPAVAAISLGLVGHDAIGEQLGRNARHASLGNGFAAAAMGACGYFVSPRAVFFVTAALLVPALWSLRSIAPSEIDAARAHGGPAAARERATPVADLWALLRLRPLVIFCACLLLFHLANTAMLPLMGSALTAQSSRWASALIAACIIVPQLVVAILSPAVGRGARRYGRRTLLLVGFAALPVRGFLFATVSDAYLVVAIQMLDGISAAVLGVLATLVVADLTRGTGHFNLGQGIVGTAVGIGASLSTTLAGYASDHFGNRVAFLGLAAIAALSVVVLFVLMPETQPPDTRREDDPRGRGAQPSMAHSH